MGAGIRRGPWWALDGSAGRAGGCSVITAEPADFLEPGKTIGRLLRAGYSSADEEFSETAILAGRSGDWSVMAAYTRRDWQELGNKGDVGGTGTLRTEPNRQDGRTNAGLARIGYDPAHDPKLRIDRKSAGEGKRVSESFDLSGRRLINKN